MSIFSQIGEIITNNRLKKLERDLHMLENRIKFEPQYSKLAAAVFTPDKFTRKITEYLVWYNGDVEIIRDFFLNGGHKSADNTVDPNLFWEKARADYRFIHSGIPALISSTMSKILFGKGISYDVTVNTMDEENKPTDEINEEVSDDISEAIDVIMDATNGYEQLIKAAANASWGGHVFLKLSYDIDILPYPILENIDIRSGEEIKKRGITKAIIFHTWYTVTQGNKKIQYRLDEIYRTVTKDDLLYAEVPTEEGQPRKLKGEKGDALIEYKLYRKINKKDVEVDLHEIEETYDITEPMIVFAGLKGMLAIGIPNKLPNNDFIDSQYGASDFAHSTTAFDNLDEVMSEMARETRDNKSIRLFPSSLLPKDTAGRIQAPDKFVSNVVKYEGSMTEGAKNVIEVQTIDDKTLSLIEKYKQAIATATNNAGISPLALGITGLEAVNAGENSQRERNKATLETRDLKIKLWKTPIEYITLKMLELNTWMQANLPGLEQPGLEPMNIEFSNCTININFPDYLVASDKENIDTWGAAKGFQVADTQVAVEKIYKDLPKTEQMAIVARIRFENGISTDNPNALSMNDILNEQPPGPEGNPPAPAPGAPQPGTPPAGNPPGGPEPTK